MTIDPMQLVESGEYQDLFIDELNWQAPDQKPVTLTTEDGTTLQAGNVASHDGIRVWVCGERPGSAYEAQLDRLIAKNTTDRLVIFHDDEEQVWRWPVRRTKGNAVSDRLTSHRHRNGSEDPKFAAKIDLIRLPFDLKVDATTVIEKVREAFDVEAHNESRRASRLMANMYTALDAAYPSSVDKKRRDHEISVTLARLLFLMFGDDTDMWQPDAFRNLVQHATKRDGSDLADQLNALFAQLDTPDAPSGQFQGFKYVNGGIFAEPLHLPPLNKEFRDAILDACAVDWTDISPAIFGSMFQAVRDSETRRALGEHYTSEENILKTLNPLFLDDLRDRLTAALARETPQKRINALNELHTHLGNLRFMDPACGCGNFIVVAYRELRAIELDILVGLRDARIDKNTDPHSRRSKTGDGDSMLIANLDLKVTLDHFHGIEIDEWPARIAETAMFLVDRQCDLKMEDSIGESPERLPIQQQANIVVGNALELNWNDVCPSGKQTIVAGNPPFLGHDSRNATQAAELRAAWRRKEIGRLDYVTGWHAKAISYFQDRSGEFAFVATNSISQGDQVPRLFGPLQAAGWHIKFAHRTFKWTSEATGAAAVHCVIVGFTKDKDAVRRLWDYATPDAPASPVAIHTGINAYLVDGPEVLARAHQGPIAPDLPSVTFGSTPRDGGHLIVEPKDYPEVMADPVAAKYVRPIVGSRELLQGKQRWCLWLVDLDPADVPTSPVLRDRLAKVKKFREDSTSADANAAAATPHLFWWRAQPDEDYLCIPSVVSEGRRYFTAAPVDANTIASNLAFTAPDPDGFAFAIVSSSMFIAWQRATGGRLESRLRFSSTLTWNNFPLRPVGAAQKAAIISAGKGILAARARHPHRSLRAQYAPRGMDPDLIAAHDALDGVVDRAFGATRTLTTERERLEVLFAAYGKLTSTPGSYREKLGLP